MDKSIIQFGYCPVQDTTYFVNIGYKLKEINYYVKVKSECSYVSYYHNACPYKNDCPIEKSAPMYIIIKIAAVEQKFSRCFEL